MELSWIEAHWFELLQTIGILGGLLFTALSMRSDDKAREIANLLAIKQQYREIWKEVYDRPALSRVLEKDPDLRSQPVSDIETLFVKFLILHLDSVRRAMAAGMFVEIQGLKKDMRDFFSRPIPRIVWEKMKPFQDTDFVNFVQLMLG